MAEERAWTLLIGSDDSIHGFGLGENAILTGGVIRSEDVIGWKAIKVVPAETLRGAEDALREIEAADPVELALDPTWAQRIARKALADMERAG